MNTSTDRFDRRLTDSEAKWFAVYTRYRREKRIQRLLEEKNIRTFLPLQRFTRRYKYKKRVVELPLISCYLFTKITRKEYVAVLDTPDVVQFVQFSNRMIAIPEQEIQWMQRIIRTGKEMEVEPIRYRHGEVVEIADGELAGIQGKLLDCKDDKNLLVELSSTRYALRMHVPQALLRRVDSEG